MNSRERFLAALERREVDIIPFNDSFSSMEAAARFLGQTYLQADDLEQAIFQARLFNADVVNLPTAGFPGGPGIFDQVAYQGEDHIIAKTPLGGQLYWRKKPYFALPLSAPITSEEDLERIEKPDIEKLKPDVRVLAEKVQKLHELDYFVETEIKGPLESVWMYLRGGYANFLMDIVRKPVFAKRLIELAFKTMLELTELVIDEAHVDAVWMTDDLGENKAPFISVEKYRDLIKPWHQEAARTAHRKGAKLCLHSHGNIMLLFEDIVETGPDSIDPLDPADGMKLAEIKEKYGDRICLMGGITKNIGTMSKAELREHVLNVFSNAGPRGYIAMSSGGVPAEMSLENFNYYNHLVEKTRRLNLNLSVG